MSSITSDLPSAADDSPWLDRDVVSWCISLAAHLALLVMLALILQSLPKRVEPLMLTSADRREEVEPRELTLADESVEEIGEDAGQGAASAMAFAPTLADTARIQTPEIEPVEIATVDVPVMLELSAAPRSAEQLLVRGNSGEGTTGAAGAIDRITQEIVLSLEQRPTLVVWFFDQSISLQMQRKEIDERFERVYEELGVIEASGDPAFAQHDDKPLLTSIVAFGRNITYRTDQPTDSLEEIRRALRGIEDDPSGDEFVFQAVQNAVQRFREYRTGRQRRNVMFVIVSDEAGSDTAEVDDTIDICRRHEIPVYTIGIPAPFGRREVLVKYVDPDPKYDQSVQMLPVEQGPESVAPERIHLGFTAREREQDELERIDSGFGPYALTRLSFETGGVYFAVHPNRPEGAGRARGETALMSSRLSYFFDPAVMRNYRPDYVSPREYERLLRENKARAALVQASQMSLVEPMDRPQLVFPKRDEANLKQLLDNAQRSAAVVEPKINQLYAALAAGEKDRERLTERRWQAGYDLAMGRVLAVKVRTTSYNAMLARAKNGMQFQQPQSDTWALAPDAAVTVSSALEKMAEQARTYLERVKSDHPGTPWALLAERELADPLGWKWTERRTGVNDPRPRQPNNNNNNAPPNDQLRQMEKPKPKRANVRL